MNVVPDHRIADFVSDPGGDSLDQRIMAMLSPSTYQIVLFSKGEQPDNIARIKLKVAIQGGDEIAFRMPKAGVKGGALTVVAGEVQNPDLLMVVVGELIEQFTAAVRTAVINIDQFERRHLPRKCLQRLRRQGMQIISFVIDGYDD